ncbi:MAG: hypothetical protein BAJATHORv1_160005 [Candidatus Thorarchaeota archaeon]|nr:MAG: hypothetical protein BAJATHORv1_160005 [Candidatus Thorarchaeota archaeon]
MTERKAKVIKPPIEKITSGRVFRPDNRYKYKMWIEIFLLAFGIYILLMGFWIGMVYFIEVVDSDVTPAQFWAYIAEWWWPVNSAFWLVMMIWMIPAIIAVPIYFKSFRYSVISEKGETMPEIFTRRGIINVTERHVPFRTITNISSKAGILDRILGIGSVEIETAGGSIRSPGQPGPEEKIEGVMYYEEVRNFILRELRKFRDPYVTGTELVTPRSEQPVPVLDDTLDDEILRALRDIRESTRCLPEILELLKKRKEE